MLRKSVSAALAVLIFALTLSGVAAWHWRDQRVPQDDCANLACTSLEIYQAWEQQGVVAGANALYGHSGWRPILLPNLTALLVFVFRGDAVRCRVGGPHSGMDVAVRFYLPSFPTAPGTGGVGRLRVVSDDLAGVLRLLLRVLCGTADAGLPHGCAVLR